MSYDVNKLRALRDNIDGYLSQANKDDAHIYEALEQSISQSVAQAMKPLVDEFGKHVDRLIEANKTSK
jgi:hypothetical protein